MKSSDDGVQSHVLIELLGAPYAHRDHRVPTHGAMIAASATRRRIDPLKLPLQLAGGTCVDGAFDPAFSAVAEAFVANFVERDELGAGVCVHVGGRRVVDLWGGFADAARSRAYGRDTLNVVFSCTKAATALCAHLLVDRGLLDLDAPVARLWPEFAREGKERATLRMMLDHSVGLPALRDPLPQGAFHDWGLMTSRLAAEAPFWAPGTDHGYHMTTFGWLVGEMVRRASGRSVGRFFAEEIAGPLGLDFHIGLPPRHEPRVAPISLFVPGPDATISEFAETVVAHPGSIQNLAVLNRGGYDVNSPAAHAAEIPGACGIANARAMAGMFAALLPTAPTGGGGDSGVAGLLSRERIEDLRRVSRASDRDRTLLIPTRFGQGFMLSMDNAHLPEGFSAVIGEAAFGHVGLGGSIAFADPASGLAFGYTMNRQGPGILINRRGQSLVDAAYSALR